ncbi:MAG TPA: type II toxin-antitoxin system prevent-host-death family antitoxin [Acidimicrobiia bacterium]|nr:type II toxin-antitoxin system prevent-host-death family antitoxin [Acidimicrobiia bacterium]
MLENLISITEAKAKIFEVVRDAQDRDVLLTRHGRPVAIVVGATRYLELMETMADLEDRLAAYESEASEPDLRIPLEKVEAELGLLP